jgi:hypothetical protein
VLWNALAPVLWRYTTTYAERALARQLGLTTTQLRQVVRVSYVKVAEFQRRGAVHFHAIVRLDAATACRCPACLAPPPAGVGAGHLEAAIREAVAAVRVPCPPLDQDPAAPVLYARWGAQLDVRNVTHTRGDDPGELSAEQVAAYLAKYATKATEGFGTRLDRRIRPDDLDTLDEHLPAHVAALVRACWELGSRPGLANLRLRRWAHMLGFRGHWRPRAAATRSP